MDEMNPVLRFWKKISNAVVVGLTVAVNEIPREQLGCQGFLGVAATGEKDKNDLVIVRFEGLECGRVSTPRSLPLSHTRQSQTEFV